MFENNFQFKKIKGAVSVSFIKSLPFQVFTLWQQLDSFLLAVILIYSETALYIYIFVSQTNISVFLDFWNFDKN